MSNAHAQYRLANANDEDENDETRYADGGGANVFHADNVHIASVTEKKRLWWRNAAITVFFISGWYIFAILLSVYNKWMFSPDHFNFPYPLFVTSLHMFVQTGLAALMRRMWPQNFGTDSPPTRSDYGRKVAPAGVATGLDTGFSNLSMKTITLSFYTMVKSSALLFVLLFAFLFQLEQPSWRLTGVILLIVAGVLLMVATETAFVLGGFLLCLSASALSGLRWSLTQLLIRGKSPIEGQRNAMEQPIGAVFYLAPLGGLTLVLISLVFEGSYDVFGKQEWFGGVGVALKTLGLLVFPGALAFGMILSEMYIIKRAGVVPMSISGIAKEVTTISISAWLFGDTLTPLNITGVAITACGIVLYTYHKYRKSIESTVPLDAHGNPIDVDHAEALELRASLSVSREGGLRWSRERESGVDGPHDVTRRSSERLQEEDVLFAVGDRDEEDDSGEELHA